MGRFAGAAASKVTRARRARRPRAFALWGALALSSACGDHLPPAPAKSGAAPAASASTGPVVRRDAARRLDPRWRAALGGDDARAAELAASVTVGELAAALADDADLRATAIRALAFVDDRDAGLGALADALAAPRDDAASIADAIEALIARQRRDVESPGTAGAARCSSALERVAGEGGRGDLDAARAAALVRRLRE